MADPDLLYRTDFLAWTREQAEALRSAARAPWPAGTNHRLDWENVAEEIEGLGTSQRIALSSQITRILHHLLKLEFSSADAPRNHWRRSIREARVAVEKLLRNNPSLRQEVDEIVAADHLQAVKLALGDLDDHGEADAETRTRMQARIFDSKAEILSDWLPDRRSTS